MIDSEKLRDLFDRAIELAPEQRDAFLLSSCGKDRTLYEEVSALLTADIAATEEGEWNQSALRNEVIAEARSVEAAVGEVVGPYRLVELIGKGGMGYVYRAVRVDAEFEKSVAVKLIKASFFSQESIARFRAERQILANLEHPNIARLLDGGARADGLPYLIMEYVEGVSPFTFCEGNQLALRARLTLFLQICSAVHYAHQNMVIHRDLKPGNILVTAKGEPKLLDFGIAKILTPEAPQGDTALTEPGMLMLTARYSSPEQVRGEAITTASDVYSLGVILYELLTGHSPYGDAGRPVHQLMTAVCDEEPRKPSVWSRKLKGDLDNIILRALRKQPLERYGSVDQFSLDILRYLEGRPVLARGDAPLYLATKFIRRNRITVVAALVTLAALVGGLVEVTLARTRAERRFNQVRQLAHSVMFDYADEIDRLPGATPVRARLVKDALTYLDNLSQEADSPQLQREIVEAYVHVSNVQGNEYQNNLGDPAAAMGSSRKAVAGAEKLLRADGSVAALGSAADAFTGHASLLYASGDLKGADGEYRRAINLRQKIAREAPDNLDNALALATCLRHMGDLYGGHGFQNLGKTSDSVSFYREAKNLVAKLNLQFPGNAQVARESYETLLSLSSSESGLGLREEAARHLGDALIQIRRVIAAEPNDVNVKSELANAEVRLGQMLLEGRDSGAAVPHMARSAEVLQQLASADPGNAMYRRNQSIVENQLASALRETGNMTDAIAHHERAIALATTLHHDAPASSQFWMDMGYGERKLSETLLTAGNASGALLHADRAQGIFCQTTATPGDAYAMANCGRSFLALGNAYLRLRNPHAAVKAFREAEGIARQRLQADPVNAIFRSDAARAQAGLATGLAEIPDYPAACGMFQGALDNWSALRQAKSLSAEDAHRSDDAQTARAALPACTKNN